MVNTATGMARISPTSGPVSHRNALHRTDAAAHSVPASAASANPAQTRSSESPAARQKLAVPASASSARRVSTGVGSGSSSVRLAAIAASCHTSSQNSTAMLFFSALRTVIEVVARQRAAHALGVGVVHHLQIGAEHPFSSPRR